MPATDDRKIRIPGGLIARLKGLARERNTTLSQVLTEACQEYVIKHNIQAVDKRKYPRRQISRAVVVEPLSKDENNMAFFGNLQDISLGGVRFVLPKNAENFIFLKSQDKSTFRIEFTLFDDSGPVQFECMAKRVKEEDKDIVINARFTDFSYYGFSDLQKYLLEAC